MSEDRTLDPEFAVQQLELIYDLFQGNLPPPPTLSSGQIQRIEQCGKGFLEIAQRDRTWREGVGMKMGPHVQRLKAQYVEENGRKHYHD